MTSYAPSVSSRANSITQKMQDNIYIRAVRHAFLDQMENPEGVVHRMWLHRMQTSLPGRVEVSRCSHHGCFDSNKPGNDPLLHQCHSEMQQTHHICDGSSSYQSITPVSLDFPPIYEY